MQTGPGFHRLRSLEVRGGFVNTGTLEFSPGLNCIIGGRGTGKTTLLEYIRYALNLLPAALEARPRLEALNRLLASNLSGGRVVLQVETKEGMVYRVERALEEPPVVFNEEGKPVSISLPGPVFSAEVYSQNEIEEIAGNPRFQLDLLDRFVGTEIAAIGRDVEELCQQLSANADRLQTDLREREDLRHRVAELPDVQEKLRALTRPEPGDPAPGLHEEHAAKARREQHTRLAEAMAKRHAELLRSLEASATNLAREAQTLVSEEMADGPDEDGVLALAELYQGCLGSTAEGLAALCDRLREEASRAAEGLRLMREVHAARDQRYRELLAGVAEEQGRAKERAGLMRREAELLALDQQRQQVESRLGERWQERQGLVHRLVEARDRRYQLRLGIARSLTERLSPMIRLQVEQCGNTDSYRDLLLELMRNCGLRYAPLVEKTVTRVTPQDLAGLVRRNDAPGLAKLLDIDRERAQRFLAQLRDHRSLHRVETVGGPPVLGYDVDRERKRLVVNPEEAALVLAILSRFVETGSTTALAQEMNEQGHTTKSWTTKQGVARIGSPWSKARLYHILHNPIYLGEVSHKGERYPGEHEAILPRELWEQAHAVLAKHHRARGRRRAKQPALLRGILRCAHCDCAMGPVFTKRRGRMYRYYLCLHAARHGHDACPTRSLGAGEIEGVVVEQLRALLRNPEALVRSYRKYGTSARPRERATLLGEREAGEALAALDRDWGQLPPGEQERLVQSLVTRVEVHPDRADLHLSAEGLASLLAELGQPIGAAGVAA